MISTQNMTPVVLLAEDSEDDAYFFKRAFKKCCFHCSILRAANGKIAIEILTQSGTPAYPTPFLLFLDLKMPVMSGFDVLLWLQNSSLSPKPRVIVLSGSNDQADQDRALALGAVDYLVKPITADILGQRISEALSLVRPSESAVGAHA